MNPEIPQDEGAKKYTGEKHLKVDPNTGAVEAQDSRYPKDEENRDNEEDNNEETVH